VRRRASPRARVRPTLPTRMPRPSTCPTPSGIASDTRQNFSVAYHLPPGRAPLLTPLPFPLEARFAPARSRLLPAFVVIGAAEPKRNSCRADGPPRADFGPWVSTDRNHLLTDVTDPPTRRSVRAGSPATPGSAATRGRMSSRVRTGSRRSERRRAA